MESDDEQSRYPSCNKKEDDTTIFDLEEDILTDEDTSMLAGDSCGSTEKELQAILKVDLLDIYRYIFIRHLYYSINAFFGWMFLDDKRWRSGGLVFLFVCGQARRKI